VSIHARLARVRRTDRWRSAGCDDAVVSVAASPSPMPPLPRRRRRCHVQRRHSSSRVVLEVSLASAKQGYSRHRKNSTKRRRVVGASIGMTAPNGFARLPQEWSRCCSKPLAVVQPGRGGDTVSAEALHHLADVEEIRIGFRRLDGSTRSVPIWVVRVGDDLYVRSVRGPDGGWYRRLRANPDGEVWDGEHRHRVRAEAVTDWARSTKSPARMRPSTEPARSFSHCSGGGLCRRPCVSTWPDGSPHRRTPPCE
jgi:hypothetical protein